MFDHFKQVVTSVRSAAFSRGPTRKHGRRTSSGRRKAESLGRRLILDAGPLIISELLAVNDNISTNNPRIVLGQLGEPPPVQE